MGSCSFLPLRASSKTVSAGHEHGTVGIWCRTSALCAARVGTEVLGLCCVPSGSPGCPRGWSSWGWVVMGLRAGWHLCPTNAMFVLHFWLPHLPGSLCSPTAHPVQPHCSSQPFAAAGRPAQLITAAGELGGSEGEKEDSPLCERGTSEADFL